MDTYKKKVVSVRDIIFDKNIVWNRKPILYFDDDIKELDKAIVYIEIPKSKTKKMDDIQLVEDVKVDKPTPIITYQVDHEN